MTVLNMPINTQVANPVSQQAPSGGFGYMNTADSIMSRPYGGISPMGPAGITDLERQGQMTQLGGMASQYAPAQQYAQNMGQYSQAAQQNFLGGLQSGRFGWNPQMQQSANMAMQSAQQPGFGASNRMYGQSTNQPSFQDAARGASNTMSNYGGGYSNQMADRINQTGASFNPWNSQLEGAIGSANQQLARDFNQQVMPQMNRAAVAAGPGAYGGTRAGVAQGLREQGLADAMQRQTTDMSNAGYEAGLNRYIQDRGNTLSATNQAMQTGGSLGMQGAQLLGNLGNMQGNLQQGAAQGFANNAIGQGGLQQRAAQQVGDLGQYSLGQSNDMNQWGFGSMMPNAINQAYQAGQQPGQIQQGMGQTMQGFGQGQQAQNQRVQDAYNLQYNAAQAYPDQRFAAYASQMQPLLSTSGNQQMGPTPQNPFNAAIGGGLAGYGAYNAWDQNQGTPAGGQQYTDAQLGNNFLTGG